MGKLPIREIEKTVDKIDEARCKEQWIFACGNGDAAPATGDFEHKLSRRFNRIRGVEEPAIKFRWLGENPYLVSQWLEEVSPEELHVKLMEGQIDEGDLLIAMSGDGNAENMLRAVDKAESIGATTIGFAGFDGGKLKDIVDLCLVVPGNDLEQIEDVFFPLLCTLIAYSLRRKNEQRDN